MRTRSAAVEGRFYPSTKSRIFDQIMDIEQSGRYPEPELSPGQVFGAVLPHAGHIYSGYQTIPFFQLIRRHRLYPDTFVIVHPNHYGQGPALAVDQSELWTNSIGEVPVDTELAGAMKLPFDHRAHVREHSAEVIIPNLDWILELGATAEAYAYKRQFQKSAYYLQKYEIELDKRIGQEQSPINQVFQFTPAKTFHKVHRLLGDQSYDSI